MRSLLRSGVAAAVLALAGAAFAYPNLSATTGLLAVPTANVVAAGQLTGAADLLFFDDTVLNARAVYGFSDRFEGGIALFLGDDSGIDISGKYLFPNETLGFNWAFGGTISAGDELGDGFQLFLAGSRCFGQGGSNPFQGTVGLSYTDVEDASGLRPFFGGQLSVGPRTEIDGELVLESGDFNETIFSLFVRHRFNAQWAGQAGLTNAFNFFGADDHDFFIGAAYDFAD